MRKVKREREREREKGRIRRKYLQCGVCPHAPALIKPSPSSSFPYPLPPVFPGHPLEPSTDTSTCTVVHCILTETVRILTSCIHKHIRQNHLHRIGSTGHSQSPTQTQQILGAFILKIVILYRIQTILLTH